MAEHPRPDPLLRALEAPLRAVLHPLGFALEIETNDRRVLECAESSFGIFRRPEHPGAPLRVRLLLAPGASATPPWPAAAYRSWRDLFSVVCGPDNFLSADLARGEVMGYFSPAMLDDAEFFRWTFLDCVTYQFLLRHYLTPLHVAGVVREEQGLCLCAPAGMGKSSLAYACLRAGYGLLSDDVVWLLRAERRPQLRGNPSRLHFPVSARELFPELQRLPVSIRRDGQEFLALRTEESFSRQLVTQAAPGPVVFLERGSNLSPALESVSPEEAHGLLFDPLPQLEDEPLMMEHSRTIRRLVKEGTYRLRYATLAQALEQLDRIPLFERIPE